MHAHIVRFFVVLALSAPLVVACGGAGNEQPQPEVAPSSASANYGVSFPEEVDRQRIRFTEQKDAAEEAINEFPTYPDALGEPEWDTAKTIYEQADEDGRSAAFAEEARRADMLRRFVEEYGDELTRDLAGDVNRALEKEGKGDFKSASTIRVGLDDAIEDHREERLTEVSNALQTLQWYEEEIGRRDAKSLEEQVLAIAISSYIVHVELVELRNSLENALAEAQDVKKTLQDEKKALTEQAAAPDTTSAQAAYIEKRQARIDEALGQIDESVANAQHVFETADEEVERLQNLYEEKYGALHEDVTQRAEKEASAAGQDSGS